MISWGHQSLTWFELIAIGRFRHTQFAAAVQALCESLREDGWDVLHDQNRRSRRGHLR